MNISDNSTPTFNGTEIISTHGINLFSSPIVNLGVGFSLNTQFNVTDGASPKFKGAVNAPIRFGPHGDNVPAEFLEGTTIASPVTALSNNTGKLNFLENNITVAGDLGDSTNRLHTVTFSSDSGTTVQSDKSIYTKYLYFNDGDASVINSADIVVG